MSDDPSSARGLRAAAGLIVLLGLGYLLWSVLTPSSCAWLTPAVGDWTDAGVRPVTAPGCALTPGTTVTGVDVAGDRVLLATGSGRVVTLALEPSGPLVAHRLTAAAWTLAFVLGFFLLAVSASVRRPADRAAGTTTVVSAALLSSTIVTVVGLPVHEAFSGPVRWAFVSATQPLFLLAWGAWLAWLVLFPTPALVSPAQVRFLWASAMAAPVVVWTAGALLLAATSRSFSGWMHSAIVIQSSLTVATIAVSLGILAVRLNRSWQVAPGSVPRQQLLWVAGAAVISAILALALWMVPELLTGQPLLSPALIGAPGLVFVAGFGVAMMRYRLFDLDVVLARTLIYSGLTLAAVIVYLSTSAVLAAGFGTLAPGRVAIIGAVCAAIIVNPVRVRLERAVNRAFYGERDEPYAALSRVATSVTDRGLTDGRVADDIRRALRAPFVGIVDQSGHVVESGDRAALSNGCVDFPIQHGGHLEGALQVAVRGPGERFARTERHLLEDIAKQIGTGLHQEGLTRQLRQSRERIVLTREEERRTLRRILHDEVGPAMAALSLRAETVRRLFAKQGPAASGIDPALASMATDAAAAAEVLRRMAYNLRPPALDEYGLEGALRRYAESVDDPHVSFEADPVGSHTPLSAAVETALYRIAVSAVSNTARHADATSCVVRLSQDARRVQLTVIDDGKGLPSDFMKGVGILAMQERAAELGGCCTVANAPVGTVVRAEIPIARLR